MLADGDPVQVELLPPVAEGHLTLVDAELVGPGDGPPRSVDQEPGGGLGHRPDLGRPRRAAASSQLLHGGQPDHQGDGSGHRNDPAAGVEAMDLRDGHFRDGIGGHDGLQEVVFRPGEGELGDAAFIDRRRRRHQQRKLVVVHRSPLRSWTSSRSSPHTCPAPPDRSLPDRSPPG